MIDWHLFAERVPVGTQVRRFDGGSEGILLENYPHSAEETNTYRPIPESVLDHLRFQPFEREWLNVEGVSIAPPYALQYLIDGIWLTFDEVMVLP